MAQIDAVLTQRSDADGLTKEEINALLDRLSLSSGEEVYPPFLNSDNSVVFGFIRNDTLREKLCDDIGEDSPFAQAVLAVANDTDLESADGLYIFADVKTLMYY